ncbi:PAS domain S-box protein [Oscillatoria sp. FACHB-1407]|uniref:PAS domain S-box protein n=1 Tax=Oscillatoria sp. FACHB-1407 TaxID=2692847 RepID=UPI00168251CD|nr:PAS domain S-box protein [Oscillatoria sp. FACHB-1407]MBD2464713.1 PAS domain S-box protein [Oscillatoria sp. FACHB-1407]
MSDSQLYADLVEQMPVGLVVWHLDHPDDAATFQLLAINALAREILGLPRQEELQQGYDPFPAFLKIEMPEVYAEVVRSGVSRDLGELRYRDRHRVERIYSVRAFPMSQQRLGVMFEDVSDRVRAEEQLRQSEQRLSFHVQQTPLAFIECNGRGTIVEWNPAAERIFGYSRQEAIGQPVLDLIVPLNAHHDLERVWQQLLRQLGGSRNTNPNVTKEGKTIICQWYNTLLMAEDGEIIGIASLAEDVTDRRRTEAALRQSEEFLRSIYEGIAGSIFVVDVLETGDFRFAGINPTHAQLTGIALEQLLGKTPEDVLPPAAAIAVRQRYQECVTVGKPITYEECLPFEGVDTWWITKLTPLYNEQNRIYRLIGTSINISDRKRIELELRQVALRLEVSNRELQDFASVASHDLQEPLRKIQAFGDRLKAKYAEVLTHEGQDYLQRMQNAANRMQTLINDLLMFSRVTTKAQPFVPVNLTITVQDVLSDLEIQIQQVGAQVNVGDLPTVDADPLQMRQLFQNLISNALKFHSQAPPIVQINAQILSTDSNSAVSQSTHKQCQITVSDNGIGFDEKYLDRIFTVFQRLHSHSEYEGTGVGLAICRRIVERHGGQIQAHSTPGQGATFVVTLPVSNVR